MNMMITRMITVLTLSCLVAVKAGEEEFYRLVEKLQSDVLELASTIGELYVEEQCNPANLLACSRGNYDACLSLYPSQTCVPGIQMTVPVCGDGEECSALYDYAISSVRIPAALTPAEDSNPKEPRVIETVCFSRKLDGYLIQKRLDDKPFWDSLGVDSPAMYFGSATGVFRIYPANQAEFCGGYDPRIRPWYVAGSSGPKNVVLLLDTSGSMETDNRFGSMQNAAKQIIGTLTVSDRIAIVPFQQTAELIAAEDGYMFTATKENKEMLIEMIDNLVAIGPTNFYDAFTNAFDVLYRTAQQELTKDCNSAVLFLTDGKMTHPENLNETDVMNLVHDRINQIEVLTGRPVFLFTYSVAYEDEEDVHSFPKELACLTKNGVWSKIDEADEIFDSLTSYYRLFSLGLGENQNDDFTAWVEPYLYMPGNILGSTVSAPIYDRSRNPPIFLGVAGIDVRLVTITQVYGDEAGATAELEKLALRSAARCPSINVQECVLESIRRQGKAGDFARCSSNCTAFDLVQVEPQACLFVDDYPTQLWVNTRNRNLTYDERICCRVGEDGPSDTCPASETDENSTPLVDQQPTSSPQDPTTAPVILKSSSGPSSSAPVGTIVGGVVGGLALLVLMVVVYLFLAKKACFGGGGGGGKDQFIKASAPPEHLLRP